MCTTGLLGLPADRRADEPAWRPIHVRVARSPCGLLTVGPIFVELLQRPPVLLVVVHPLVRGILCRAADQQQSQQCDCASHVRLPPCGSSPLQKSWIVMCSLLDRPFCALGQLSVCPMPTSARDGHCPPMTLTEVAESGYQISPPRPPRPGTNRTPAPPAARATNHGPPSRPCIAPPRRSRTPSCR